MSGTLERPKVIFDTQHIRQPSGQCDCDCDCACSLCAGPAHNRNDQIIFALLTGSSSLQRPDSWMLDLGSEHVICYGPRHRQVVLNRSAWELWSHFDRPASPDSVPFVWRQVWGDAVVWSTLAQMLRLGLLMPDDQGAPRLAEAPTLVSAWLHVTDRCNLRCAYCYLPHTPADMSAETGHAAVASVFRSALRHGYKQVKLKYAGGEPLLRFPLIGALHRQAQNLADQNGQSLDGVVLCNGTLLTAEIITTMQALGLRLMVSLDGLGQYHDRQRHFAAGRGSFDAVASAIDLALSHDLVPNISVTVSGRSIDGLAELVAWVLARDLPFSLNFYRENDFAASEKGLQLEEEKIIQGMLAAFRVIEANLPRRSLLASLVDRANLAVSHQRTCSAGRNYLVFDPQGKVAKCQMDMGHSVTDVHAPDPLAHVRESFVGIDNLTVDEKEDCKACRWRYWCAGGCPLLTYRATGRYDVKSPHCNVYRALYPEVVRLEGLRLLKYAQETWERPVGAVIR